MEASSKAGRQQEREAMVERQLARRGVADPRVLAAMREVPREAFLPPENVEFAYEDSALPIAQGQTISQPYIVALMAEALELEPGDRVLEVGTGSGYAAAILSRIAKDVYTIERHGALAESANEVFGLLGYDNIHVRIGDGTLGWPEEAPFDAIVVAAGGPSVPLSLREQLAPGGRLVIPTGSMRDQHLVRIRREGDRFEEDDLGEVRFVPLIGAEGWEPPESDPPERTRRWKRHEPTRYAPVKRSPAELIADCAEPIDGADAKDLGGLLDRIGDARVVLLGEATHGTSEFYRMRARITRELVEHHGFRIVALEADWPDAARVDAWLRDYEPVQPDLAPFSRFPLWMWRNHEFGGFLSWLRQHNEGRSEKDRAGLYGLDLYSLYSSLEAVVRYLDDVDPDAARVARVRYGCLTPWEGDPAAYGRAVLRGRYRECEEEAVALLSDLLKKRMEYGERDGRRFLDAERNAALVANAERYYRVMYYGSAASWNLRDEHMFETLLALLDSQGEGARAVVWAHNSHLGDASATEMHARGELNLGQLVREHFADSAYLVGFGTHAGSVAAADDWGEPVQIKTVRASHERSYERLCHDALLPAFLLALREPARETLREALAPERLERAIGVIYRPETELQSHYFHASLPRQFDEYVWFDLTRAVQPIDSGPGEAPSETFPFGV
jgi:protein-L-isoaspartate(D-aspartate) O-methyltransferase